MSNRDRTAFHDESGASHRPLRTVLVTAGFPWPATGGMDLRNLLVARALKSLGPVAVLGVGRMEQPEPPDWIDAWRAYDPVALRGSRTSVERFRNRYWYLRPRGHWRYDACTTNSIEALTKEFTLDFKPNLVIASQLPAAPLARVVHKNSDSKLIFDTHNVEADLRARLATGGWRSDLDVRRVKGAERRLLREADISWVCSDDDANMIAVTYNRTGPVDVVPNAVELPEPALPASGDAAGGHGPPVVAFVGTLGYQPNHDAALELLREIMPLVRRELPNARLRLIGREPRPELAAAAEADPAAELYADVPDVLPLLRGAECMVVPIREGSGTRLKILEAMANGVPVVSTPKGIEGIRAVDGDHAGIADAPAELAARTVSLLRSDVAREAMVERGRELVADFYGPSSVRAAICQSLGSRLPELGVAGPAYV